MGGRCILGTPLDATTIACPTLPANPLGPENAAATFIAVRMYLTGVPSLVDSLPLLLTFIAIDSDLAPREECGRAGRITCT